MCGIIGYTGELSSVPFLIEGLKTLEYRGYDSAGIAVSSPDGILVEKARGRLSVLEERLDNRSDMVGTCGIGHTRWATHGEPSDRNSHPHATERLALVHNGIIENYASLASSLQAEGYTFVSETDTEVAAKLIDSLYRKSGKPENAIFDAVSQIRGSFAFAVLFADHPDTVFAIRKNSPLVIASGKSGSVLASDVPAILAHTNEYYRPEEEILAILRRDSIRFFNREMQEVSQPMERVDWSVEQAQKGGFPHFMLKEIYEEPEALRKTVGAYTRDGLPFFEAPSVDSDAFGSIRTVHMVACGTAMHAGLVGKSMIESLARVPVNVEIASEFRYRDPILHSDDLVILLSQSGETADTLAALRHAKSRGVRTLAIVNVMGSSVAREADEVLYTRAGPEIAVASTKAYTVQCAMLCLLAIRMAVAKNAVTADEAKALCTQLAETVPAAVEKTLTLAPSVAEYAGHLLNAEHLFYIGRGADYSIAVEASLKLKEISYIHSEAYAAGELKHGTISLIEDGTPVIALTTQSALFEKTVSGIREARARGAYVLSICDASLSDRDIPCDGMISVPSVPEWLSVFPATTVMQLLAYFVSAQKGLDVDKPRNLAKSVTVE